MADDLIIDLTNFKDRMGNRVLPGRYTVVVEDTEMDQSKAGNQMINIWYRVLGGDFDGATITDRLVLTEKSLFRVVGFMQAVGLPTPRKRLKLNVNAFNGKVLDVDVDDGDPYNGRVRSEVRGYMRSTGAQAASEEPDDLSDVFASGTAPTEVTPPAKAEEAALPAAASNTATDSTDDVDLESIDLDSLELG